VRLSNTGTKVDGMLTTYQEFAYPGHANINWSISNATGGSTAIGTHRVWAQYGDYFGNWSQTYSDTIWYDPTAPVVTSLKVGLPAKIFSYAGVEASITWSISDSGGSGIGPQRELQFSRDGGSWHPVTGISLTGSSTGWVLDAGHSYKFRFRVRDRAGNLSNWRASAATRGYSYSETSSAVAYTGSWGTIHYINSSTTTRSSSSAGSSATFTFTGRSVGWLAVRGPGRGKASVYIDGNFITTVNLDASTTKRFQMAFRKAYSSSGTHKLKIVAASSQKVEIDNFYVLR
jgi:hypothetical protein